MNTEYTDQKEKIGVRSLCKSVSPEKEQDADEHRVHRSERRNLCAQPV